MMESATAFLGTVTPQAARVYLRLPPGSCAESERLVGVVRGPYCDESRTLPAAFPLRYLGADPRPLATATLLDPTEWSPELPAWYEVEWERRNGPQVVDAGRLELAVRRLGAQRRSLFAGGERWVLRGAEPARGQIDWEAWRAAPLAILRPALGEAADDELLLREASRRGALVVPWWRAAGDAMLSRLAWAGRFPAVWLALLEESGDCDPQALRDAAPNLLLARRWTESGASLDWADLWFADASAVHAAGALRWEQPIVVMAPAPPLDGAPSTGRAACERLQRDLAPLGDFAGYLVGGGG